MPYNRSFTIIILILAPFLTNAQDSLRINGQSSGWIGYAEHSSLPLQTGARYLPEIYYHKYTKIHNKLDFKFSFNLLGYTDFDLRDKHTTDGNFSAYRAWGRYSGKQFEIRAGLQKIDFGVSTILRPLMWFNTLDPNDPLQLTNGLWGILGRYYFLDNTNIWLWGLYGNHKLKGWESIQTNQQYPEYGGRIQRPVKRGEIAASYHHRTADSRNNTIGTSQYQKIAENRIGIDGKWDIKAGLWLEASWTGKTKDLGNYTNQEMFSAGADYTFGVGNGLYMLYEQLLVCYDQKAFAFTRPTHFSALTASYPLGLFNKLSTVHYYDWKNKQSYNFLHFQRQLDKVIIYLITYWNPSDYLIPSQDNTSVNFAGKGIQLMLVFNH